MLGPYVGSKGWVPMMGNKNWRHSSGPKLRTRIGPKVGSRVKVAGWVGFEDLVGELGLKVGSQGGVPRLGSNDGCHCFVPRLGLKECHSKVPIVSLLFVTASKS